MAGNRQKEEAIRNKIVLFRVNQRELEDLKEILQAESEKAGKRLTVTRFIKDKIFSASEEKKIQLKSNLEIRKMRSDFSQAMDRFCKRGEMDTDRKYLIKQTERILESLDRILKEYKESG